ncbi:DUF4124 domain-containing protein [Thioalkalivibrio denitrificans]|uniref:DUF4124 domain-containing protein n=1 Tax=Thioalkalivibrio denitrificans TaxID=108003 RepID=A0A1V3N8N7_9GAMM|nr:DUF4124 domain-containing protein [Thioalkalivibrio denitrificans]OOG21457.1 DUF4124 domain-containing protein [Thioalkalivibrio denitrificans]
MKKLVSIMLAGVLFAGIADAQIYRWVDEHGNVHFGDCPPPECPAVEVPVRPGPSKEELERAQERLERLREEQRRAEEIRRQEAEAARLRKEEEQRIAAYRKSRCILARQNLHVLEVRRPVYYIDERGERVYLDDKTRTAEMERLRAEIVEFCD